MSQPIVAKFGGTSVKNANAIRQVADIIKQQQAKLRFIVVSAVSGITNLLLEFCHSNPSDRNSIANHIWQKHFEIIQDLNLAQPVIDLIQHKFERLNEYLSIATLNKAQMDHLLALGEDASYLIVANFLQQEGVNITAIDARSFMVTDDHFGKASPDTRSIKMRLRELKAPLVITQGFVGATSTGDTTTLGRGGGDTSAALIAEGINASELFIYTDVPGVYTMDPNVVDNAHLINELSFQEMAEMANFGAKIVHPATLEPCLRAKIPIRILSTFAPNENGTLINITESKITQPSVRAITLRKSQVLVTLKSLKMLNAYGFLANIFKILAEHKISIDLITTSEVSVALTIDGTNLGSHGLNPFQHNTELLQTLSKFAEVIIEEDFTLIAIVGSGLTTPGMIQKIMSSLEQKKIRLICFGASQSSIGLLVLRDDANFVAKLLHKELLQH